MRGLADVGGRRVERWRVVRARGMVFGFLEWGLFFVEGDLIKRPKFSGCCQIPVSRYREPSFVDVTAKEDAPLFGESGHRREKMM